MRLKSEIWVKAYLRRCAGQGVPVVVVRRGDEDAGVIFVKIACLDGTALLYGPAPAGIAHAEGDRRWALAMGAAPEADVDARLARERDMDPDLWIVEIEDRQGRHFLDDWLAEA
jgi:hypothetical protein